MGIRGGQDRRGRLGRRRCQCQPLFDMGLCDSLVDSGVEAPDCQSGRTIKLGDSAVTHICQALPPY